VKRSVIILLAAALTGFASLANAQAKIGVVNTDALLTNSPQFAEAQRTIDAEFLPRTNEIQALQKSLVEKEEKLRKDGATMTELQRTSAERELTEGSRTLRSKTEAAEEDFNARKEEVMAKLQRLLRDEIGAFAKANSYDLILVSGVGYASAAYDVTKPLLDAMNKKAGVVAPPAATPAAKPPATPATPAAKP
jgi:outer membrane protein